MSSIDNDDAPTSLWDDGRTKVIVGHILSTYPKLSPGAKFDKLFQTDANR